jgi:glucose-6-phosphate 1-dehydrogenase
LRAIRPFTPERVVQDAVAGQYVEGQVDNQEVAAYRSEPGVDADSRTETFAALCLYLDNWRWADMPIYVRSGKRLARRLTEIHVVFRPVPRDLFSRDRGELRPGDTSPNIQPNALTLRIQPDEGFWLTVSSKVPGAGVQIRPVGMDFSYHSYFEADLPDAYERLLHDIARGDPTLFARGDEVEAAWAVVDSLFAAWAQQGDDRLHTYPAGSWGPKAAHNMLARARRMWRNSCDDEALVGQRCSLPRSH